MRLSVPPNAVVDSLGQPVTGQVDVSIVPLDPTSQLTSAPGPLEGLTSADGEAVALESIFMADVSLWRGDAPLQLAPGSSATLEFLIPEALARPFKVGDTMPAWWFDLDEGLWREEGAGTFQPSQTHPGRLAWAATVNHFTYWNVDKPVRKTVLSCVNVRAVDAGGNPVPNLPVSALAWDGREATWVDATHFTGADGQACTTIKQGFSTDILAGSPDAPLARTAVTAINRGVCSSDNSQCLQVTLTIPPLICDGAVNEDANCLCPGVGTPCYGGPPAKVGVGICQGGTVGCDPFGAVSCMGQQLPQVERCWTPEDDDCDGVVLACHSGEWTAVGNLAWPRSSHTATLLRDGKVLVVGGQRSPSTAEVYDPATGTWSDTLPLYTGRMGHSATLLPDGKVLVAGGVGSPVSATTAEVYDPATGTWSKTGSLVGPHSDHTATLLPNGKVLIVGGSLTGALSTVEVYDPATGTWSAASPLISGRYLHTATLLPNGKVLIAGGFNERAGGRIATAEVYDPATGTWSATGSLPSTRSEHAAALLPDGKVLVMGGIGEVVGMLETAEMYDPAMGTWSVTGPLAEPRYGHTATSLPNGKILVTGGDSPRGALETAALYHPATGTWSATGSFAAARNGHTATLLLDGRVLVVSTSSTSVNVATAEVYTP